MHTGKHYKRYRTSTIRTIYFHFLHGMLQVRRGQRESSTRAMTPGKKFLKVM